jgi:hypothetical protein
LKRGCQTSAIPQWKINNIRAYLMIKNPQSRSVNAYILLVLANIPEILYAMHR